MIIRFHIADINNKMQMENKKKPILFEVNQSYTLLIVPSASFLSVIFRLVI